MSREGKIKRNSRQLKITRIARDMIASGLDHSFVKDASHAAKEWDGIYGLLEMWADETDPDERHYCVAAIRELLEDIGVEP